MNLTGHLTEEDEETNTFQDEMSETDNNNLNDFEDYSLPNYKSLDVPASESTSGEFLWILLWIMSFWTRFNLPEICTESLIKFIKIVLKEISCSEFDKFPNFLYIAWKKLSMQDSFHTFAICLKCHKLYKKQEVEAFQESETLAIMKYRHVKFSNSNTRRFRQYQAFLSEKVPVANRGFNLKSILLFLFAEIFQQLEKMYKWLGFEDALWHWTNHAYFDDILTDIYDGWIWKNFEDSDRSSKFFHPEVADSHLDLVLNLDWFQPYDRTIYNTGVIYAAICNLPRNRWFWRKNMLILGLLPGLTKVSLHKINHYLILIVDELDSLWREITINRIFECQTSKKVQAALILVSCNIPAARKLCGHVLAFILCYWYEKKANYENN